MSNYNHFDNLTLEEKNELKASEVKKLDSGAELAGCFGIIFIFQTFLALCSGIATVLWFNNVTVFISAVLSLSMVFTLGFGLKFFKDYRKDVKEVADRINIKLGKKEDK